MGDLPVLKYKKSYPKEWSNVDSQFLFFSIVPLTWYLHPFLVQLSWDLVSQRFSTTQNYYGFRRSFPIRLVWWPYNMYVFVTYLGNIGPSFHCGLLWAPISICLPDLSSWTRIRSTCYISYPFHAWGRYFQFLIGLFLDLLNIILNYFKNTLKIWFRSWKLTLSIYVSYFVSSNSYKSVIRVDVTAY